MTKRNMKIEINESQPLDEVVRELGRLGYCRDCDSHGDGVVFGVMVFSLTCDFNTCNEDHFFKRLFHCHKLTTLAELKEMKCTL